MKKIIFTIFCAFFAYGNSADASLYVCNKKGGFGTQYLISVENNEAAVFYAKAGVFESLEGKTKVYRAFDGGPLKVVLSKPDPKVNWENTQKCYIAGGSKIEFEINVGYNGDEGSNVYYYPKLIKNPAKNNCDFPIVTPARPNSMACNVLD